MTAAEWLAAIESTQPGCDSSWQRTNDGLILTVQHEAAGGWRVVTMSRAGTLGVMEGRTLERICRHLGDLSARSRVVSMPYVHRIGAPAQRWAGCAS